MADHSEPKTAAELQRETELQRSRLENTIDQLQDRLSPGQLVDEFMSYGKAGGGQFLSNLGSTAMKNPMPVALMGIGLAWLIARPGGAESSAPHRDDRDWDRQLGANGGANRDYGYSPSYSGGYAGTSDAQRFNDGGYEAEEDHPFASVKGSAMQRLGNVTDAAGARYSEFVDDAGKKFKALTDDVGNRAGHFSDEAGNVYKGFTDEAGNQIAHFRDEAGNILQDATGWASHVWRKAREGVMGSVSGAADQVGRSLHGARDQMGRSLHDARDTVGQGSGMLANRAMQTGSDLQRQAGRATSTLTNLLHQQPLVGGALAFAAGAAIASTLPHTAQEDKLLGETADNLRRQAGDQAQQLYSQGREQVTSLYETAQSKAADILADAKDTVTLAAGEVAATVKDASASIASTVSETVKPASDATATTGSSYDTASSSSSTYGSGSASTPKTYGSDT